MKTINWLLTLALACTLVYFLAQHVTIRCANFFTDFCVVLVK